MMAKAHALLTLVSVLPVPFALVLIKRTGRIVGKYGVMQNDALARVNAVASEAIGSARAVQLAGAEATEQRQYAGAIGTYLEVIRRTLFQETALRFIQGGLSSTTPSQTCPSCASRAGSSPAASSRWGSSTRTARCSGELPQGLPRARRALHGALAGAGRLEAVLRHRRPRATGHQRPRRRAAGPAGRAGRAGARGRVLPLRGAGRNAGRCATRTCACALARSWPSWAPAARASPRCCASARAWPTRRRAPCGWTARTCGSWTSRTSAAAWASWTRTRPCSTARSARTSPTAPSPPAAASRRRPATPAPRRSSPRCPAATRSASASAARGYREASGSASRSRGRSCAGRPSSCWTSRPPRSTARPRRPSRAPWRSSPPGAARSSSRRTASRPSPGHTAWWCCRIGPRRGGGHPLGAAGPRQLRVPHGGGARARPLRGRRGPLGSAPPSALGPASLLRASRDASVCRAFSARRACPRGGRAAAAAARGCGALRG
ncbi:unnamed protein product [Prorocentrum cordatum]|uniref:ABC transmembrane type-1 domain-containing protein n=1 Tax=Prorocentrum cordatum TaxID=2364126 RepID=A0ABN9TR71_9DINO|nr:unnamed protein product [Polarella glacialis]